MVLPNTYVLPTQVQVFRMPSAELLLNAATPSVLIA